jgi:hypothetical protein
VDNERPALASEALLDAEARLRVAAREYSNVEHTQQSIECRRRFSRELRAAARHYAQIADGFDAALKERTP